MKNFVFLLFVIVSNNLNACQKEEFKLVPYENGVKFDVNPEKLEEYRKIKYNPASIGQVQESNELYKCSRFATGEYSVKSAGFPLLSFVSGNKYCLHDRVIGVGTDTCYEVVLLPNADHHTCVVEHGWMPNHPGVLDGVTMFALAATPLSKKKLDIGFAPAIDVNAIEDNTILSSDLFVYLTAGSTGPLLHCVDLDAGYEKIFRLRRQVKK